jgi:hypothetical protein
MLYSAADFLCPVEAVDKYGLEFISFRLHDHESGSEFLHMGPDIDPSPPGSAELDWQASNEEDVMRTVKYTFDADVLRCPFLTSSVAFHVGDKPLTKFRMIERHYFRSKLIRSYDFLFGFCIPGSTNTWESVYDLPPIEEGMLQDMVDNPFETTADTFYFVDDELVIHNKSCYQYVVRK